MKQTYDFNPNLPSLALGGGGTFGMNPKQVIWMNLKSAGRISRTLKLSGTSAGSWVGGFVATEKSFDEITSKVTKVKVPN